MAAIVRDRAIVVASLVAVAGLAWAYLFRLSQDMSGMEDMPGMTTSSGPAPFSLTATMWAVMMVGMMLPSALPMILLFTMVQRRQGDKPAVMTATFAAGYLLIWGGFALVAAALQTELGKGALLSPSLTFVSTRVAGMTFLLSAAYEFSPLKNRCLTQCSSPIEFYHFPLAPWRCRCVSHGAIAWDLLCRLLLGIDAVAVHSRCDEPTLGCCACRDRSRTESSTVSTHGNDDGWNRVGGSGSCSDRSLRSANRGVILRRGNSRNRMSARGHERSPIDAARP